MKEDYKYCGSCTFCCIAFDVPEINKKAGQRCPYLAAGNSGCSNYESRPQSCKDFHCIWQSKMGLSSNKNKDISLRPDKLGIVMVVKKDIAGHSPAIQFIALNTQSLETEPIQHLAKSLTEGGFTIALTVAGDQESRVYFPIKG